MLSYVFYNKNIAFVLGIYYNLTAFSIDKDNVMPRYDKFDYVYI